MNLLDLFLIAFALSLDAFSVSISCGIKLPQKAFRKFIKISITFALFQASMPLLGHLLAKTFLAQLLHSYCNWIAFSIFFLLGAKTLYDYFSHQKSQQIQACCCNNLHCLTNLAIATSIDAFLVGSVLGLKEANLFFPLLLIGSITLINSLIGCILGNYSIRYLQKKARLFAAIILIVLAFHQIVSIF